MAEYIIKQQNEKWIWDFKSDQFKIKVDKEIDFDDRSEILIFLKEFKFYDVQSLEFEEIEECLHLILDGKTIAKCIDAKKETLEEILLEMKEAKITWEIPENNPAHEAETNDTTPNEGPTGS